MSLATFLWPHLFYPSLLFMPLAPVHTIYTFIIQFFTSHSYTLFFFSHSYQQHVFVSSGDLVVCALPAHGLQLPQLPGKIMFEVLVAWPQYFTILDPLLIEHPPLKSVFTRNASAICDADPYLQWIMMLTFVSNRLFTWGINYGLIVLFIYPYSCC